MSARLLFYTLRRRILRLRRVLVAAAALVALGLAIAIHAARPTQYTLTVVDFNLNPSAGNSLFIYQGDRQVTQANVFNGTLLPSGAARFRLPPGDYVIYVTRGMLDTRAAPSGALRSASLAVPLRQDTTVDFLRQARVNFRGS